MKIKKFAEKFKEIYNITLRFFTVFLSLAITWLRNWSSFSEVCSNKQTRLTAYIGDVDIAAPDIPCDSHADNIHVVMARILRTGIKGARMDLSQNSK